ncbi:hypothetical protein [Pseudomonas putida]|uniref:hypothetical protein n=1 Tax=Pseudomonas putida TaxID=303 RepID=UPI002022E104|nr:hypothetical protein [Pseudomonas putida]MCL8306349.1 hypothetical protein [Pseudomonas putida]
MPWYRTGTVAITAGQNTVTGTGTNFSANARVGDAFQGPDGRWYEVTNIASSKVLSILPVYQGETVAAGSYGLAPMQGYVKESADRLRAITDGMESIEADVEAAHQSALDAAASATAAGASADQASQDRTAAQAAAGAAQASQQAAAGSSTSAGNSAQEALGYRNSAQTSASQASASADAAAASAAAAAESEHNVSHKANSGANSDITSLSGLTTPLSVNQGGTGGGTTSSARSSLGLKSASVADIVGLVSQVGGVPTGAIIERGSNANGDYVKFADGTLICWKIHTVTTGVTASGGSVFFSGALAVGAWATPFVSKPTRVFMPDGGAWSQASSADWDGVTAGTYQLVRYVSTPVTTWSTSIIGIGRWF